jgi:hypothetical protein
MRKDFVVGAAVAVLAVFCASAMASSGGNPPYNTPKALKAFSRVELTIQPPKKAVAQHLATFMVRLHNPTRRTFHNVRMILASLQDQSKKDLVQSSVVPLRGNLSNLHANEGGQYFWFVYSLPPGASKIFVLQFGIRKEPRLTKKVCLKIVGVIFSPASVIPGMHRAKGCTPYRLS